MQRFKLFAPLLAFIGLSYFLYQGLSLDPTALPSARLGERLPAFSLPALDQSRTISPDTLPETAYLLNVWATWCYSCRVEHPFLLELARRGVPVIGLNYKDEPDKARAWLTELGNPYQQTVVDREGRLGLDLGVYGAPETYVVDGSGVVRYRHVGVVTEQTWSDTLAPFFEASL